MMEIMITVEHPRATKCCVTTIKLLPDNKIHFGAVLRYKDVNNFIVGHVVITTAPTFEVGLQKLRDLADKFLANKFLQEQDNPV